MIDQWTFIDGCEYFAMMDKEIFRTNIDRFVPVGNYSIEESMLSLEVNQYGDPKKFGRRHGKECSCGYCRCAAKTYKKSIEND